MSKMHFLIESGKKDGAYIAKSACGLTRDSQKRWEGSLNPNFANCTICKKYMNEKGIKNDK